MLFANWISKVTETKNIKEVKWCCYRPGVAQRVGRGIALLFHDNGTRRGWVVSSTPRPHFTPGKDPVPILQEAGWAPGPIWTDGKSRPHRDSILDRPARSSVAIPSELPGPHSQTILIAFPRRQWLRERASVLRYKYTASHASFSDGHSNGLN